MKGISVMNYKEHKKGVVEILENDVIIKEINDWSDLFVVAEQRAVIIKRENLNRDFFDLRTGFAGELLQKFSTYNKKMAILGDYSDITSKALNDFIYESNLTKQIIFVETIEDALNVF